MLSGWAYGGRDIGITLFDACLKAGAPISFRPGMTVLEVGCCESDWLEQAAEAWPPCLFVGVDQAPRNTDHPRVQVVRGDVRNADLFQPESVDAVVSLSALEHIGLGHYGDPVDPEGDTQALANIWRWLKPGGWVYFDVPYDPTGYRVLGTECRVYDDAARWTRLWQEPLTQAKGRAQWRWEGYVASHTPGTLIPKPETAHRRFWYAAMVWHKC